MKKVVNLNAREIVCAKCKQPILVKVQVVKSKQKVKTRNNPRRKGRIYND